MTERHRDHTRSSESDKNRRIAELEAAVRARDEFLAAAAHELRNPITAVLMRLNWLLRAAREGGREPDEIAAGLEVLHGYLTRYMSRATTLLDVSRITSGKFRLEPATVDLSALLREVAHTAAPVAAFSNSPLNLAIQEGVVGIWDQLAVEQIVDNLVSNALKYGAGEPVEVGLTADDKTARITVRDQGIGISTEDQARIFESFERAATRSRHGGFGVGLWIVGRLVAAIGGTITVASKPGEGSTFTVSLPIKIQGDHPQHD